jgi:hypothetical protein
VLGSSRSSGSSCLTRACFRSSCSVMKPCASRRWRPCSAQIFRGDPVVVQSHSAHDARTVFGGAGDSGFRAGVKMKSRGDCEGMHDGPGKQVRRPFAAGSYNEATVILRAKQATDRVAHFDGAKFWVPGSGTCPTCNKALTSLLTPTPRAGGLDSNEYLPLVGALGVFVGLARATTAETRAEKPANGTHTSRRVRSGSSRTPAIE